MKFKQIYILYSNLHTQKNRYSIFLKTNSYTNTRLKFRCDAKLITSLLFFLISTKNLKAVYLSFHWFDDSWNRWYELVTPELKLLPRRFELTTREFELITPGFELVTRGNELVTYGFELVTCGFELVTRGFELAHLNLNLCF